MSDEKLEHCKKITTAVYLACEESVAKDISEHTMWLISELESMRAERDDLSIKLQRTVSAAYHALLEMSAWMGIPEKKRSAKIDELMGNVKYCAEHDLRHIEESQEIAREAIAKFGGKK